MILLQTDTRANTTSQSEREGGVVAIITKAYSFGGDYEIYLDPKLIRCDGKSHPTPNYRRYRRGYGRCLECGCIKGWLANYDDYNGQITNSNIVASTNCTFKTRS